MRYITNEKDIGVTFEKLVIASIVKPLQLVHHMSNQKFLEKVDEIREKKRRPEIDVIYGHVKHDVIYERWWEPEWNDYTELTKRYC